MMERNSKLKLILNLIALFAVILLIWGIEKNFDSYKIRILNLAAIYVVLGLSLNLINGFTGMLSLGHAGFMCIGAYTAALLTMTPEIKEMNFYLEPIWEPLKQMNLPLLPSLMIAGLVSALFGYLIAYPVLRLKGDYLAIASLGFAEIIRVIFTNTQTITNGSLGIKGLPTSISLWWNWFGTNGLIVSVKSLFLNWSIAIFTLFIMIRLVNSAFGRTLKAIRDDEIAAEAMGINLFKNKLKSFTVSSFFAGVGGALLGFFITSIDPNMFRFMLTFNILAIVVLGGLGSLTGSVIAGIGVTIMMEVLRFVESPMNLGFIALPGIPGMRMVIFSLMLLLVILFYQKGLMGTKEFSWNWLINRLPGETKGGQKADA